MGDKWELFWMGIIFSAVVLLVVCFANQRADYIGDSNWKDGYKTGYAESKAGLSSRYPNPLDKKQAAN